ncbi:MAG: endolytic transglycosylase MltG [Flavonifractor plautii]
MTTTVTIPEGMTEAQIFALLEEKGVSTVEQLEEAAANYDFKFSFLKGVVPLGDPKRLEGYLFPDTYEFYMGEEPVSVLNKMILRFDEIFTDEMRQEVQNDGRTIQDVVTVASMIEKETDGSDQAKIASVIYNRLDNPTSGDGGLSEHRRHHPLRHRRHRGGPTTPITPTTPIPTTGCPHGHRQPRRGRAEGGRVPGDPPATTTMPWATTESTTSSPDLPGTAEL